jgi:rhodanese-related sulfurtransferase
MNATAMNATSSQPISLIELRDIVAKGEPVLIAEILPAKHYDAGHIPGARHLPLEGFETTARTVAPDKDARIVVYCASSTCANSDIAARKLGELGYTNVRVFRGGKAAWTDAGLALADGAA